MAILNNGELIPAPAAGVRRYGLFNAATVLDDLDARGIASGFQFPAEDCGVVRSYDANCDTHPAKTFDEGQTYMDATPYWVYASRQCGTVGRTAAEMEASVMRRLLANEQHEVESQLWGGGAVAADPNLTGVAGVVTVVPGVAQGAGAAIAALEQSFYDTYGYVGTIHVNTAAYAAMAYAQILERNGSTLNTPLGSVWSFGSGYGIAGPGGAAPAAGSVWAFMTPPVLIRRSAPITRPVVEVMDRLHNQFLGLAERVYAHSWVCDTVHAVQVPLDAPSVITVANV